MSPEIRTVMDAAGLAQCHAIRQDVFVDEQAVPPAEEWDDRDASAAHYLLVENGQALATARLRIIGAMAKIERVAVRASARGRGAGAAIMRQVMAEAAQPGVTELVLSAQTHAVPFYAALGFVACGEEYLEAGIPHYRMTKPL